MKVAILTPEFTTTLKVPDAKMVKAGLSFQHRNLDLQASFTNMVAASPSAITLDVYWRVIRGQYILHLGRAWLASIKPTPVGFDMLVVDGLGPRCMQDLPTAMRAAEAALGLPVVPMEEPKKL